MGLSRRKFNKEFKEAAVRRLELGASMAEVARACEVNANVLHRWRKELKSYGANGLPSWSARSAARRWRSIFCVAACRMSRSSGICKAAPLIPSTACPASRRATHTPWSTWQPPVRLQALKPETIATTAVSSL